MYALPFWQGRVAVAGHTASLCSFTEQNPALYRYLDESMMPLNLGVAFAKDYDHAFVEDINQSIAAGMNEHLSKPLNIDDIIKTICKYTHP